MSETCGIPAATIERIAREIAAAPSAAVYGRIGLCNQEFGTLASWLVDVINVITGNFDRPGGLMFGNPIAWSPASLPNPQWADGYTFGRWRSRVRGAPEVLGQVPVSCLAEEIATPGAGQLKGLITIAGNPVISAPDAGHLEAALPELECMISVDNWLNETTRHAHVILPGLSALEQPHYDELIWSWAARSAGNFSPAVFPRRRPSARVGDPGPARRLVRRDARRRRRRRAHSTTASSRRSRWRRGSIPRRCSRSTRARVTRMVVRSACSTSRSAPARGATGTASSPTG